MARVTMGYAQYPPTGPEELPDQAGVEARRQVRPTAPVGLGGRA
ncbi:hypothetical protein [Mycobacterium hackensackense]|nr:hypothetical protein [Mycobacterium hackensackense]